MNTNTFRFEMDDSEWPVVKFNFNGDIQPSDNNNFEKFLEAWSNLYLKSSDTGKKFKLFLDVKDIELSDARYAMGFSTFLKETKPLITHWMDRTCIFNKNGTVIKHFLQLIFSLYKPTRPFKYFDDEDLAMDWLKNSTDETVDLSEYE